MSAPIYLYHKCRYIEEFRPVRIPTMLAKVMIDLFHHIKMRLSTADHEFIHKQSNEWNAVIDTEFEN